MGFNDLDQTICAVLATDQFQEHASARSVREFDIQGQELLCCCTYCYRYGEKLHHSWQDILGMLRSVADASEKELVTLGFQSLRVIMNDGISTVPVNCLQVCVDVTGAYSAQKTELNISLTAIGLLWTAADFIAKDSEKKTDETFTSDQVNGHASSLEVVDPYKMLLSVFSLLHTLGIDERPEVRNSSIRTLFQTLGTHGQKLPESMWEDCLWKYVFPTLDRASHMAATSSRDESYGKELGTRGGKAVHMLIHHSRNTAQKQWDETLVLVLGGIARLLRSFFPLLRTLRDFWSGWQSLLVFVKNSILTSSKEVSLAAINCLQTTVVTHSAKGNLPMPYLDSILDVYKHILVQLPNQNSGSAAKVKQEILHGLGELFVQAERMFTSDMYKQLIEVFYLSVQDALLLNENAEFETGFIPPLLRTMLEVLPQLSPGKHLSSMWYYFLHEVLQCLPEFQTPSENEDDLTGKSGGATSTHESAKLIQHEKKKVVPSKSKDLSESVHEIKTASEMKSSLYAEKLVMVLVDLVLRAPMLEKCKIYPEIVQRLGRCMMTRRDNPDGAIWRVAVEGFNRVVVDDVTGSELDPSISKSARIRIWKEVADVYEIFLLGYCGRALPSNSLSQVTLKADESLELSIVHNLGDTVLKSETDVPLDILQRLVSTLDRCASRTCSLPVETVELLPPHCGKFSMTCLQKLFSFISYNGEADNWGPTRCDVSRVAITVLMDRCQYIFNRLLMDEQKLGELKLPTTRLEEAIYVLEELARLKIHPDTASVLPLQSPIPKEDNHNNRSHLIVLYQSFCELIVSREPRVRNLVQVLLRLVGEELGLQKLEQPLKS